MTRRRSHRWAALPVVLGLSLVLSSCGSSSAPRAGAGATRATPTPSAPATATSRATYVALGDSYTSFPGTSTQIDEACQRSSRNYPHLVAATLGLHLIDRSCSGAATGDLTSSQRTGVAPQLSALTSATRLVTLSIGANNVQLISLLGGCLQIPGRPAPTTSSCGPATVAGATGELSLLEPTLVKTYREVRRRAPHARLIVVGYPQILGRSGGCAIFPIPAGDVRYVDAINSQLNAVIRRAAGEAAVDYLDIAAASMSHGICSTAPWINGIRFAFGRAFPVHPFANEQQAVARLLEARVRASSVRSPTG